MLSSLNLLFFIRHQVFVNALPKLEHVPDTCARPGYRARYYMSSSTKEISACGVYLDENCPSFSRYAVSQLAWSEKPNYDTNFSPRTTTSLLTACRTIVAAIQRRGGD